MLKGSSSKQISAVKKHRFLNIVLAAFFVFIIVQFVMMITQISEKKQEITAVDTQISEQRIENNELKRIIETGSTDEYIERIAREKYNLVMPDERVFINILGE